MDEQKKRSSGHIQLLQYNQQQVARLGSAPQTSRVDATQTPNALSARQSSQQPNTMILSIFSWKRLKWQPMW